MKFWLAILLVLNAAVLAWQWDAFARWGHGPNREREPERLQQQVRHEALKFEPMPPATPVNTETAEPAVTDASAEAMTASRAAQVSAPDAASSAPVLPSSAAEASRPKPQ